MEVEQINRISSYPQCGEHELPMRYFCRAHVEQELKLACGDCLLEHHKDHIDDMVKVSKLVQEANESYSKIQGDSEQEAEGDEKANSLREELAGVLKAQEQKMQKGVNNLVQELFTALLNAQTLHFGLIKNPRKDFQVLKTFFDSGDYSAQEFSSKMGELEQMNVLCVKKSDPHSTMPRVDCVEVAKIDHELEKQIKAFVSAQESTIKNMSEKLNLMVSRQFSGANVEIFNFSWNPNKRNQLDVPSEGRVNHRDGCEQQRYILSTEAIPTDKCSYFEIYKEHTSGCYDSIGLCKVKTNQVRNGNDSNGWAVRLYGEHSDLTFSGKVHGGNQERFYDQWQSNAKVGVFFNPQKGTLSYFENKKFLGTAFDNVLAEQDLFVCLEVCHKGYYALCSDVELPERDQWEELL